MLVVKNINFSGNANYSDSELKSKIITKEDAWYKIFGSNKFLPERLELDKDKLKIFIMKEDILILKLFLQKVICYQILSGFNINFILNEGTKI